MPNEIDSDPPVENPQQMPMILPGSSSGPTVEQPAKLIRIASMIRELLEDVRQSKPDEAGRNRLREVYKRALAALKEGVSKELQDELETLTLPLENTPSDSEVRLAQAQLLGWLEGLFQGIQAALWTQHMQARAEIEEMRRRRGLPPGPGESYLVTLTPSEARRISGRPSAARGAARHPTQPHRNRRAGYN